MKVAFDSLEAEQWPTASPDSWAGPLDDTAEWAVYCVSDLHVDHVANFAFVEEALKSFRKADEPGSPAARKTCCVVAGDVATKFEAVSRLLELFVNAFDAVFFVPGNHELWYVGQHGSFEPEAFSEAKKRNPLDPPRRSSIDKFLALMRLCHSLGVYTTPAILSSKVAIVPLYSWYDADFAKDGCSPTPTEQAFDAGCAWPQSFLPPADDSKKARGCYHEPIGAFFANLNARRVSAAPKHETHVISFSHFLPRPEVYLGRHGLAKVMGSQRIDAQLRECGAKTHVCGHSHLNFDVCLGKVRYVQEALGYPHERRTDARAANEYIVQIR